MPVMLSRIASGCLLALFLTGSLLAAETPSVGLHSGIYEGLMLAVDPDGKIQGQFREEQGQGVTKTCSFFLVGQTAGAATIPIQTWQHDIFPGTLSPTPTGVELAIPLGREHPGCDLVLLPAISRGIEFSETRRTAWRQLAQITVPRAVLRAAPTEGQKSRPYVVQHDIVGVIDRRPNWLHVEYVKADQGTVVGWISATEAVPLKLPEQNQPK